MQKLCRCPRLHPRAWKAVVVVLLTGAWHVAGKVTVQLLRPDSEFGVLHYELPGQLQNDTDAVQVLAHVFVKCLRRQTKTQTNSSHELYNIRGFIKFEQIHPRLMHYVHAGNPDVLAYGADVQATVLHLPGDNVTALTVSRSDNVWTPRPHLIDGSFTTSDEDSDLRLVLNDWDRQAPLSDAVYFARTLPKTRAPGKVYVVMAPLFGLNQGARLSLLDTHIRWHRSLGFDGHYLYSSSLKPYNEEPKLLSHIRSGALKLMSWRYADTGLAIAAGEPYYTQIHVYNHALLAFWGKGAWLLLTDVDEFFATPEPASLQMLFDRSSLHSRTKSRTNNNGCFATIHDHVFLHRRDVVCGQCLSNNSSEWDKWTRQAGQGEGEGLLQLDLMSNYTDYFKALVMADEVAYFGVHQGFPIDPEGARQGFADVDNCAFLAHLKFLDGPRYLEQYPSIDWFSVNTTWHWPLTKTEPAGTAVKPQAQAVKRVQQKTTQKLSQRLSQRHQENIQSATQKQ